MGNLKDIICWWSGGITSAVACKESINLFGKERCRVIFIDTHNEDSDTYRFKIDCQLWYGIEIETITGIGDKYKSISDVWFHYESLNTANGAICSTDLKRLVREKWQKENTYSHQVFGFEFEKKEFNRAVSISHNHVKAKGIFPLLMLGRTKDDCVKIVQEAGIEIPRAYQLGFKNNNCLNTGCVQGGIGYWQKMKREFPDKFYKMGSVEHELTDLRGEPVTMLKDQSNSAKEKAKVDKKLQLVFLVKHPDYPDLKCIDDMPERKVQPLNECSGFCGTNLYNPRNEVKDQLNFSF